MAEISWGSYTIFIVSCIILVMLPLFYFVDVPQIPKLGKQIIAVLQLVILVLIILMNKPFMEDIDQKVVKPVEAFIKSTSKKQVKKQ